MDPVRLGHAIRALRLKRRWRQVDLAERSGTSRTTISRLEAGRLSPVAVGVLVRTVEALDATLEVRVRWNGEALDRLLDQAHAGLVERVVVILRELAWIPEVEATFSIQGERGAIDVLAYHPVTGLVLVIEVKSVVPDSQVTLAGVDRKARVAPELARARGWDCRGVAKLLVIGESSTSRRRIDSMAATYRTVFRSPVEPSDGGSPSPTGRSPVCSSSHTPSPRTVESPPPGCSGSAEHGRARAIAIRPRCQRNTEPGRANARRTNVWAPGAWIRRRTLIRCTYEHEKRRLPG